MKLILTLCILTMVAFGQSKTVKVGTEKKLDLPARAAGEGVSLYRKALKSRSTAERTKFFGQSLSKFKEALSLVDQFVKDPSLDPNGKYQSGNDKEHRADFMFKAAKAAARAKSYTDADKFFDELTSNVDKENAKVWYEYGDYLFDRSKKSIAKNAFENAIKFGAIDLTSNNKSDLNTAKKYTAYSYYKLGEIENGSNNNVAIQHYKNAISFDDEYWQAYLKLGKIYETTKSYNNMLDAFTNVLNIMDKKRGGKPVVSKSTQLRQVARSTMFKGMAQYFTRNYNDAIQTLKTVDNISGAKDFDKNSALYHIGLCYKALNDKKQAISYFKKTKGEYKKSAEYEIEGLEKDYTN